MGTTKHRCPDCKYDLSGCTTGVWLHCPECGFKSTVGRLQALTLHRHETRRVALGMVLTLLLLVAAPIVVFVLWAAQLSYFD